MKSGAKPTLFNVAIVLFTTMFLLTLHSLWSLEISFAHQLPIAQNLASNKFMIAIPWATSGLVGAVLWVGKRRGEVDARVAVLLLFLVSTATTTMYDLMGMLVMSWHG